MVEFLGRKYGLDAGAADETYKILMQTLSDDGTVPDDVLRDLIEQTKQETGVKKAIDFRDIIDYSLIRQLHKELIRK